jgi:GntR family transcriptional regulator, transcriptional repressor for pyruvate dehydrogenase complex
MFSKKKRTDQIAQTKKSRGAEKVLLSQQIANTIEADVANGKFKKDGKLPSQGDLCARFFVSGSVIREAIHLLKAKGILYTVNGVGSFVAERSVNPLKNSLLHYASGAEEVHDYSELMELRLALETTCAEKIAEHSTPEALKRLHTSLKIMEASSDDIQAFSDADLDFHTVIVEFSGNSIIKAIYSSLGPTMRRFMDLTCNNRQDVARNCKEHRRIYQAISSGNIERASQALRDHLLYARRHHKLLVLQPGIVRQEDRIQL